ncbi:hypothetical protein [Methylobacterium frigidaeris]|uniref:Uncharacterized protein n=1 Tax=Methylobacterium frigidaeris TaxID=2038277 RepID=A0AA37HB06_9HYPH|nr:hypothetical protein [Methylobacterium frigidaeris]PIK72464.1 hypothetical protein CS379_13825 [Methylobacterium frigidaeris]GJD61935.1 hypothetical protein MPEAHAMD_2084 [Methylobacterium frigidaeris]
MPARPLLTPLLALGLLAPLPALAQQNAVSETGTGGGPASTIRAPNTSAVGQTVPKPGTLGPDETGTVTPRNRQEEKREDQIMKGICIGCSK